mgnify:FL=1
MAKKSGLGNQFYVGGFDLSGDVGAISNCGSPVAVLDVTGLNQSAMDRVRGLADGSIEFNAWFNDAAGQSHLSLRSLPTADRVVLYAQAGSVNAVAAMLRSKQINYDWSRSNDGSLQGTIQALASAGVPLEWGVLLSAGKITHASASSSASKDDAAATSNGAAFYLELVSLATGTATVTVEDSADNAIWATLASFAAVAAASAPTAERIKVSGTVRRYLRITTTGTFTTAIFVVGYRRGTAQDTEAY